MSEKNYPPRAWLRPDHLLEMKHHDAVEFLSLAEHADLLATKDAEIARLMRERDEAWSAYDSAEQSEQNLEAELAEAKARLEVAREALRKCASTTLDTEPPYRHMPYSLIQSTAREALDRIAKDAGAREAVT